MRILNRINIQKNFCIYSNATTEVKCHLGFGCSRLSRSHRGSRVWEAERTLGDRGEAWKEGVTG